MSFKTNTHALGSGKNSSLNILAISITRGMSCGCRELMTMSAHHTSSGEYARSQGIPVMSQKCFAV
jgi:hypothetical protein